MENPEAPIHLEDQNDLRSSSRVCAQQADGNVCSKCPCCKNCQVSNLTSRPQPSALTANPSQKRKRGSKSHQSDASVESPELELVRKSPIQTTDLPVASTVLPCSQSFTDDIEEIPPVNPDGPVQRFWSPIPPEDLPVALNPLLSVQPSSSQQNSPAVNPDSPVTIHNYSVEEFQKIYHEVVDDRLKYNSGRPRPYSLDLGRCIKQKLWERLNRPKITTSVNEDGLEHTEVSYGVGVYPPLYDVDIYLEPEPGKPPNTKPKN